jgi:light-harvesting complex I chlorophyll a/b binding protein 1
MQMSGSDRAPGDFGFDPLMLLKSPNAEKYKLAELTHGRAAMIAFSSVVTHSAMPGAFGIGKAAFPYF